MDNSKGKWLDGTCPVCDGKINSWDQRCSKALGYNTIHCEKCICQEYDREVEDFRDYMEGYFGMRPCRGI